MITTNNKSKVIFNIILVCSLLSLHACYEESTGCLDITAANYDASADNNCTEEETSSTCPCEYNSLDVNIELIFDTLSYSLNDTIPFTESDTLKVTEAHLILSNFCLMNNQSTVIKTQTEYDINNDGEAIELNDIIVYNFSSSQQSIGTLQLKDSLSNISFHQGISNELNNANFDFSINENVQELIDSSYINDQQQIASFRIKYQNIKLNDTIDHEAILFLNPADYTYDFEFDQVINYNNNPTLNLSADIALLFKDVDLNEAEIDLKLTENLKNFISLKE